MLDFFSTSSDDTCATLISMGLFAAAFEGRSVSRKELLTSSSSKTNNSTHRLFFKSYICALTKGSLRIKKVDASHDVLIVVIPSRYQITCAHKQSLHDLQKL
mmetsp:Transcript_56703/g.84352  ORF Transcript_56703/g.84352 Transcript_56703/m.84352 type:complete len:102 (+) Transcript_56703:202-507(+)